MLQEKLNLDNKDVVILSRIASGSSQSELASLLKMSQPSINARIKKLKNSGLLSTIIGIDIQKTDLFLTRVDLTAIHAEELLKKMRTCSFFVNGFILSGKSNVSILIAGESLKVIESLIDRHLRSNPEISNIDMAVVVSTTKPFICSINLEREKHESCSQKCIECELNEITE